MSNSTKKIDINYVANLARIELSEDEKQNLHGKMQDMLNFFEIMNKANIEGIEPTAHPFPLYNVWEADEPETPFTVEEALANSPNTKNSQILVPKVVE